MVDTVKYGNNEKVLSTATVGSIGMTLPGGLGTMVSGETYRIGSIPANSIVTGVDVIVDTAFNGTTPTADVSVGITLVADNLALDSTGLTRETVAKVTTTAEDVTFVPTLSGATIGAARVIVYFTEPELCVGIFTE